MKTQGIFIAWAAALSLAACTGSVPRPTSGGESVIPAGTLFEIIGPDIIPLGGTVQFNLIAQLPNGSKRDVTNEARWSEAVGSVLSIAAPGLLTGRDRGDTQVFVEYDRYQRRRDVMVLPPGTYRLTGRVSEADFPANRVAGAQVEVTSGVESPLTVLTDALGIYRLYGVAGQTELRVTKDGYRSTRRTVAISSHQTFDVELPLSEARANLAGTYRLTITAANHCGVSLGDGNLPEDARVRSYTATIEQSGPRLSVTLSRPASDEFRHGFEGSVEPGRATFTLRGGDESVPILEWLPTSNVLEIDGSVSAAVSAGQVAGTLTGMFRVFERAYGGAWLARCLSTTHSFVLSR